MTRKELINSHEYVSAIVECLFEGRFCLKKKRIIKDITRFIVEHRHEFHVLNSQQELNRSVATNPNSSNGPDKIPDNK